MELKDRQLYCLQRRKDRPILIFGGWNLGGTYYFDLNSRGDRSAVISFPVVEETDTSISFEDNAGPNSVSVLTEKSFKEMQPFEPALQKRTWVDLKKNGIAGFSV